MTYFLPDIAGEPMPATLPGETFAKYVSRLTPGQLERLDAVAKFIGLTRKNTFSTYLSHTVTEGQLQK